MPHTIDPARAPAFPKCDLQPPVPFGNLPAGWKFRFSGPDGRPTGAVYEARGSLMFSSASGFDGGPWHGDDLAGRAVVVVDAGEFGDPQVGDRVRLTDLPGFVASFEGRSGTIERVAWEKPRRPAVWSILLDAPGLDGRPFQLRLTHGNFFVIGRGPEAVDLDRCDACAAEVGPEALDPQGPTLCDDCRDAEERHRQQAAIERRHPNL